MKPPFAYYGGKQTLAGAIAAALPEHDHYVEAFAGSLAVLLAKRPSRMETVNDLDGDIVAFWRALRDQPDELIRVCALTPHARGEYALSTDRADCSEIERARRVWVKLTQGRGGMLRRTGWRYYQKPGGSGASMPDYLAGYVERMPACADRLLSVSIESLDALELIRRYGGHDGVLIYADPPYLKSTKGWGNNYVHDMGSDSEHRDLAKALNDCRCAVVLSGYHSPLYDELYEGWHRLEMSAFTGQAPSGSGDRTEVLWANRSFDQGVLDFEGIA